MLIYFVRHGQTDFNLQRKIQGDLDIPLNAQGLREAELIAEDMKDIPFSEAWSSDLQRASVTAEKMIAKHPGLKLTLDQRLQERSLGSLQGKVWDPVYDGNLPNDVESSKAFRRRIIDWLRDFFAARKEVGQASDPDEHKILVLSHGGCISTLFSILLSQEFGFDASPDIDRSKRCLNTSIMRVRATYDKEEGEWDGEVLSWGEVYHLDGQDTLMSVADDIKETDSRSCAKV